MTYRKNIVRYLVNVGIFWARRSVIIYKKVFIREIRINNKHFLLHNAISLKFGI